VRFCRSFCPSEFSVSTARRRPLPSGVVLSWNSLLVQSFLPVEVSCLWVCLVVRGGLALCLCVSTPQDVRAASNKEANASCSRFVVGPCLSCTVFLRRGPLIVVQCDQLHPLFEFCVPPEFCSVHPRRPAAARQLLSWAFVPFSTFRGRRSTCCELAALTLFRLQGLVTLLAVCSLRSLAGSVSHRQRSWDSPFGVFLPSACSDVSIRPFPLTVSPAVVPDIPVRPARQAAVPGLSSGGSPFQRTRI
jgi:hypothetical protein